MTDTPPEYTNARIRIKEPGALVLREALYEFEVTLREERVDADATERRSLNAMLKELRFVLDEVERTIDELGWDTDDTEDTDELQRPVAARPGSSQTPGG